MECERLKKLVKNWYVQVQDESMAPARMVDFMRNHVADCLTCMADPVIEIEVKRITEIVLPPDKIPKAARKDKAQGKKEEDSSATASADDVATDDVDTEDADTEDVDTEDADTEDADTEDDVDQEEDGGDVDPDDKDDEI
jgi:hypothetical protein